MEFTVGNFKVKPYKNSLCWEVWEFKSVKRKTGETEESWVFTEKYPRTFEGALKTVFELSLMRSGKAGDLKDAMLEARSIAGEIRRAAKGVK